MDQVRRLVEAGLQAPSGDNCQPWRFVWDGRQLAIHLDRERAESLYDVERTASWTALGALLANMRLAAGPLGLAVSVELFPRRAGEPPAALVSFEPVQPRLDPLAGALSQRCANRRPYRRTALADKDRAAMQEAVAGIQDVWLDFVEAGSPAGRQIAWLAALNDRILFENRALHDGLYRWLRWSPRQAQATGDGLPAPSLELRGPEALGFRAMASWPLARLLAAIGVTRQLPKRTQRVYERSSAFGLIRAAGSQPEDFVRGGEALQRMWLTATRCGVALQPVTGMICLWLRARLRGGEGLCAAHRALVEQTGQELTRLFPGLARSMPVMLVRVGYAPAPSARSPRRAVSAVLETRSAPTQPVASP